MPDSPERFQKLTSYGVIPAPSGAGAVVIHAEEGRDCRVVLRVIRAADKTDKITIVTLARCRPDLGVLGPAFLHRLP